MQVIDNEIKELEYDMYCDEIKHIKVRSRVYTDLKAYYEKNFPKPKKEAY